MTRILGWRRLPTLIRWLAASVIFGIAFALRFTFGPLHEAARFLIFYPAIIIAAVLLGWKEAIFVLVLSLSAGWYFFLPPGMSLLIVGWALVGSMNIAIIAALKTMTEQLAEANERQRLLFQELQHRVANTLQSAVGKLEIIKNRMRSNPAEATNMMDEAIERMSATADMHHQLHDPILFEKGLESMLREVVATVIDQSSVSLNLNVEELDLSLDQKSVIAMLVIEVANNSAKHVFRRNLGSLFEVSLVALPGHRAMLRVKDDGPGTTDPGEIATSTREKLGMRILQGLADQIHGTLNVGIHQGMEVTVDFPTFRSPTVEGWWRMRKNKKEGRKTP
jgi:two-component sensor histidine kinase